MWQLKSKVKSLKDFSFFVVFVVKLNGLGVNGIFVISNTKESFKTTIRVWKSLLDRWSSKVFTFSKLT